MQNIRISLNVAYIIVNLIARYCSRVTSTYENLLKLRNYITSNSYLRARDSQAVNVINNYREVYKVFYIEREKIY